MHAEPAPSVEPAAERQSAEVLPLRPRTCARKEDAAAAAVEISQQQHAARVPDFNALLRPLEALAGRRLNGPNRSKCLAAFAARPENFRLLVEDALARGRSNPLGLLFRMVIDSDHEYDPPAPETPAERELRRPPTARPIDDCMGNCGKRAELWEAPDGRLLCVECNSGR
jgi:hypothetical protein